MKRNRILLLLALLSPPVVAAPVSDSLHQRAKTLQAVPRISHEALAKNREATFRGGGKRSVTTAELLPKVRRTREGSEGLIARSTILCNGSSWTIVPKEAVVHVPSFLKMKVGVQPAGRLVPWREFLGRNRNWLMAQPVTLEQAAGRTPIDEAVRKLHKDIGRVVVAVCQNGPISVKTPPPAEDVAVLVPEQK